MEPQTKIAALISAHAIDLSLKTTLSQHEAYEFLRLFCMQVKILSDKDEMYDVIRIH